MRGGAGPTVGTQGRAAGTFRFGDKLLFLSNALKHYPIGLEEIADGLWSVYFSHVLLARIDERTGALIRG